MQLLQRYLHSSSGVARRSVAQCRPKSAALSTLEICLQFKMNEDHVFHLEILGIIKHLGRQNQTFTN